MKESIIIRDLGPIKDIEIGAIRPLTVIIGESASGKSTLMKVIALMRYIYKMLNIRAYLKNANISRSPFRLRFERLINDNGLSSMFSASTYIKYAVSFGEDKYEITYSNKKLNTINNISREHIVFYKGSFVSENRNMIPTWASKVAANRGATLGFYFHETYSDFDAATDSIKEQNLDYLGLKLQIYRSNNKIKRYMVTPVGGEYQPVELKNASSGIQTSAPLLSIVRYYSHEFSFKEAFRRSVLDYLYEGELLTKFAPQVELGALDKYVHIHIEEPELSLYPDAQCRLVESMVNEAFTKVSQDRHVNVMMATHSPYIINYLNVLLRRWYFQSAMPTEVKMNPEDVAVYKIEDGRLIMLNSIDMKSKEMVINTLDLSRTMNDIYSEYIQLSNITR
jgi:predicted ATPase